MSIFKRVCSIVLVAALVITVFAVAVYTGTSAEEPEQTTTEPQYVLSLASKPVSENAITSLDVTYTGDEIYGASFSVSYDSTKLEISDVTSSLDFDVFEFNPTFDEDKVFILISGSEPIPNAAIATVSFVARENTAGEHVNLELGDVTLAKLDDAAAITPVDSSLITTENGEASIFPEGIYKLQAPYKTLVLTSDITFICGVNASSAAIYDNLYVKFKMGNREERKIVATQKTDDNKYWRYDFKNVNPYEMAQDIFFTVYGTYNGVEYSSVTMRYSVVDYCTNTFTASTSNLNTLMADLLNYGTSVQKYVEKIKMDGITDTGIYCNQDVRVKSFVVQHETKTTPEPTNEKNTKYEELTEGRTFYWRSSSLSLGSKVSIVLNFNTDENLDDVTVKIYDGVTEALLGTYTKNNFKYVGKVGTYENCYSVEYSGFGVAYMRRPVHIVAYKGETKISHTYQYSIESYAVGKTSGYADTELMNVCCDMVKYGRAAESYSAQ